MISEQSTNSIVKKTIELGNEFVFNSEVVCLRPSQQKNIFFMYKNDEKCVNIFVILLRTKFAIINLNSDIIQTRFFKHVNFE